MAHITQQFVDRMVTKTATGKIEWDDKLHGFGVRANSDGTASYLLDYYIKDKRHRKKIGKSTDITADAARREAGEARGKAYSKEKIDPFAQRDAWKGEPTFKMLAEAWLADAAERKRPSSLRDDRRMLGVDEDGEPKDDLDEEQRKKCILAVLGAQRLTEIKQRDIDKFHKSLKATKYAANRMLALVKSIFNYGVDQKWLTANPAKGIKKFEEGKRERFLTIEELQRFREALDKFKDQSAANALRLLMLTGSREGEVLKAAWEEFDLQRGVWTKPSHHTKQKKVEHVPLSAPARKLLAGMYYEGAHGPLFPGKESGARVTIRRPWVAACRAAGLVDQYQIDGKRTGTDGEPVKLTRYRPTLRIHDLRHNFASHLASNGVSLQVVGKLLGHTQVQTTARYSHLQDEALRAATNKFGDIFEPQTPKAAKRRA